MAATVGHPLRPGSSTPADIHRACGDELSIDQPRVNLSASYQAIPRALTPNSFSEALQVDADPHQGLHPSVPNTKSVSSLWIGDLYAEGSQPEHVDQDVPRLVVESPLHRSYATVQRVLTDAAHMKAQELDGQTTMGGAASSRPKDIEKEYPITDSYIMNRLYQSAKPTRFRTPVRDSQILRSHTPRSYASLEDLLKQTALEKAKRILKEDAERPVADPCAHREATMGLSSLFIEIPDVPSVPSTSTGENHFHARRATWFPKSTVGKRRKVLGVSEGMQEKLDALIQVMEGLEEGSTATENAGEALMTNQLESVRASISSLHSLIGARATTPAAESRLLTAPKLPYHAELAAETKAQHHTSRTAAEACKETCEYCRRPIGGYYSVTALGRHWHSNHLRCFECRQVLSDLTFYHLDKRLYCKRCWTDNHSVQCEQCRQPILETCIEALGKVWHPEHFQCAQCGKVLALGTPYIEHKDRAYCEEDYNTLFSPVCGRCDQAINKNIVFALGKNWHPQCLACMTCNKSLADGTFFDLHGASYCEEHYHEVKGSICSACNQPIIGKCLNVMGRKYHTEHFVCSFCTVPLGKMGFKEGPGDKPYCLGCHGTLFRKA